MADAHNSPPLVSPPSSSSTLVPQPEGAMSSPPLESPNSPLMANLNRLSQATSRPNLPPPEGVTTRTLRSMSQTLRWTPEKAGEELDELILRSTTKRRASASIDTGAILYPTLENHPAPLVHPLLVLNLAAVSHVPGHISNDELLEVLLRRLEPWVGEEGEGGYCLIVLAAEDAKEGPNMKVGGKSKGRPLPGVAWWLWHWRRIPRKFRKNLKRLYIVHPSALTRTIVPLILPLVSPKSYSKVHTVPSLMALTHYKISLRGMDLPLSTLAEEARILHENPTAARRPSVSAAMGIGGPGGLSGVGAPPAESGGALGTLGWGFSALTSVLGSATSWLSPAVTEALDKEERERYWAREIDEIVKENGGHVPRVVSAIGSAILLWCADTEGIFRRSANSTLVHALQALLDLPLNLQPRLDWAMLAQHDPLLPPIMLKKILAAPQPPVFSPETYEVIKSTRSVSDITTKLLPTISSARALLLDEILHIAHHLLPHEATTRMSATSLALMLAPSLIAGPDPRADLALLMEPGSRGQEVLSAVAAIPGASAAATNEEEDETAPRTTRTDSAASAASDASDAKTQGLPPPPPQTLVGVLEIWITKWPVLHGSLGPCECSFAAGAGAGGAAGTAGAGASRACGAGGTRCAGAAARPGSMSPTAGAAGTHALLNSGASSGGTRATGAPPVQTS